MYRGKPFGSDSESYGEVVFTTSMTGYVESVTDPSYRRQTLVFAEPTIANYPVLKDQMESSEVTVSGVVCRDAHTRDSSGFGKDFSSFLNEYGVPGIDGIDTRSLILKIRRNGVMKGYISNTAEIRKDWPDPLEGDVVGEVLNSFEDSEPENNGKPRILSINVGEKYSLRNHMRKYFNLTTVDHHFNFSSAGSDYDAIFVSNGPGDPASPFLSNVVEFLRKNIGEKPLIGICLGHQLIGRAYGLRTVKMHFGHRGSNHAATDGRNIWITTHNHGYAVENPEQGELETAMWDVNDGTVEMLKSLKDRVLSVQFHPEASPGPSDASKVFAMFSELVGGGR